MKWLLPLLLVASQAHAGWTLDLEQTELAVKVFRAGAAAKLAHDHIIRAGKVTGSATADDAGHLEALELTVDVASLTPDEPEVRRRYHLPNTPLSDDDRAKVKEHLLAEGQLDVAQFPTITFKLARVVDGVAEGTLTLHGVTKPLSMPVKVERKGELISGEGRVKLKTPDFGVKAYSAALGLIRNNEEVELQARVVLRRTP
ncbi:MAG TPA: YceI family protein [Archangium sp.]